jgi:hypothetical protein
VCLLALGCSAALHAQPAGEYFEGFDHPGKPAARGGISWSCQTELSPASWRELIPGDGFAYLSAERDSLSELPPTARFWPFQTLSLGPVSSNHRISMRARNTALSGVACMLFTYREDSHINEIDIEIVADDLRRPLSGHATGTQSGWTDVRLNTWLDADAKDPIPTHSIRSPILDAKGRRVSHQDGKFHIYTIEWRPDGVRFFIDRVPQATLPGPSPRGPALLIFGMRQMPWAGKPDWTGTQTMLVDWIDIEPLP